METAKTLRLANNPNGRTQLVGRKKAMIPRISGKMISSKM
jgi:hypothetical protein